MRLSNPFAILKHRPQTSGFRPLIFAAACLLAASPASRAGNQSDQWYTLDLRVADSSAFFLQPSSLFLSTGTQWFRNALSNPITRIQRSSFAYDSAGDPVTEAGYVGTLTNAYNPDADNFSSPFFRSSRGTSAFVPLASSSPNAPLVNGTTYTWSTTTTSTSWLNSNNWTGVANHYPGVDANASSTADGAANDIALFTTIAVAGTAPTIGINFNTSSNSGIGNNTGASGSLALGTIDFNGSKSITLNNSSTTLDGTLTLNGGNTINTINDTIIANEGGNSLTFTNGSSKRMDIALGDTTNNVIQINGAGSITITSLIKDGTGPSNLTLTSTGTPGGQLILNGPLANTFSGTTTVDKGTMNLVTAGALGATTGVTVNSGGTLLLSGSAAVTDRINNAAPITLNGGTFNTGGLSEGSATALGAGVGALTLSANSTIDFGTGTSSILQFAGLGAHVPVTGADLAIVNWSGSPAGGGTDQLLFTGSSATFQSLFDQSDVSFNGITGYNVVQFTGYYEVVPIPELSTWIGAALALGAIGVAQRRRLRALVART